MTRAAPSSSEGDGALVRHHQGFGEPLAVVLRAEQRPPPARTPAARRSRCRRAGSAWGDAVKLDMVVLLSVECDGVPRGASAAPGLRAADAGSEPPSSLVGRTGSVGQVAPPEQDQRRDRLVLTRRVAWVVSGRNV